MLSFDRTRNTLFVIAAAILVLALWLFFASEPRAGIARTDPLDPREAAALRADAAQPEASVPTRDPISPGPASDGEDARSPLALHGRVVRAVDGAPIAGADVLLLHREADEFWNLDLDFGKEIEELEHARSDSEGRFRFDVERARTYRLNVRATGFADRPIVECTGGSEVLVEMSPGARIDGVVREAETKAPVPGVDVCVWVRHERVELGSAHTATDGSFHIADLPPVEASVLAWPARHVMVSRPLLLEAGAVHTVEIELEAGRTLRGHVLDAATRTPVADAEVSDAWTFDRRVHTDADGSFTLFGIQPDSDNELHVRASGYVRGWRMTGAQDQDVDILLERGGRVTGRLVQADGAVPAAAYCAVGAPFMFSIGESTDWIRARVDSDGRFAAEDLNPSFSYSVYARARGCGTRVYALPHPLASGESLDVGDVVLRPAGGIEARVTDESDVPIAGLEVSLHGKNADSDAWLERTAPPRTVYQFESRTLRTDADGRIRCTGLAAGKYTVRTGGRLRLPVGATADVRDGEVSEVALQPPLGLAISGTLRRNDGVALGDIAADILFLIESNSGRKGCRVGTNGSFRCAGLTAGLYTISMLRGPQGWSLPPVRDVAAGTQDLALVLRPAAIIGGRVLAPDGTPIAQARVWFAFASNTAHAPASDATTAGDGSFELEVPPDVIGAVHTSVERPYLEATQEGVTAGQRDLVLRLAPPPPIGR